MSLFRVLFAAAPALKKAAAAFFNRGITNPYRLASLLSGILQVYFER
jgi:hypothetical protein